MVGCMNKPEQAGVRSMRQSFLQRFSLLQDKADDEQIERQIRDGVEMAGATPWILMFAIVVASVGLNVNSTAVIIGAMLISPLMGPIMGAGLGVAVYDFDLVKRSLTNLGIATLISLFVSALYFSLTPLQQAQSELLARTSPSLWDVLIALFGGLAGIVVSMVLKAVFLGILGGPIASLSWLALIVGAGLFFWGFTKIRDARSA